MPSQYTVEKGCPLCKSDVRGNTKNKYYCKKCRIIYNQEHLRNSKIKRKYNKARDLVKIHFGRQFVTTASGKVYHIPTCAKLKKYNPINLRVAKPTIQKPCTCTKPKK